MSKETAKGRALFCEQPSFAIFKKMLEIVRNRYSLALNGAVLRVLMGGAQYPSIEHDITDSGQLEPNDNVFSHPFTNRKAADSEQGVFSHTDARRIHKRRTLSVRLEKVGHLAYMVCWQ